MFQLKRLFGVLLLGVGVSACDGDNLFTGLPRAGQVDADVPVVKILDPPSANVTPAQPLGDSLLVTVDVRDDTGIATVVFQGLAFRGDAALGTDSIVERFETKVVDLLPPVGDTILSRYLKATPDSTLETVQIIVTAIDTLGNSASDTVAIFLGGPDVDFLNLTGGELIQAGRTLGLRVKAQDGVGIRQVEIIVEGVVSDTIVVVISPVVDSLVVDTIVTIPAGVTGQMTITARAWNSLDVIGQAGPLTLTVTAIAGGDTIAPLVQLNATSEDRLELQDLIHVEVNAQDNNQGSGVVAAGYTVLGISPRRGDTVSSTDQITFGPRTGTVTMLFDFQVFNADALALPDTLVYEVFGWAVDDSGNCGVSVGAPDFVALACGQLAGFTVAENIVGDRLTRVIVGGRTVLLPTGGKIMDAVMDTVRRKLYMSYFDRDRIEIFRLQDETFETAAPVGSEPWGVTLNRDGDTLLVANSGGTNISMVDLGTRTSPWNDVPVEDPARRLLTPDVVLFDVETSLDDAGSLRYNVSYIPSDQPPGFTDRPQFVAVDVTGRILYSTKTSLLGDFGTLRKASVPALGSDTEVKLFIEHASMIESTDFTGVAHADLVVSIRQTLGDLIQVDDHTPGDLSDVLTFTDTAAVPAVAGIQGLGGDAIARSGRWDVASLGFHDTTYVFASGDRDWVVFGEGSVSPVGRIIMYDAVADAVSGSITIDDLMINGSESVRGVGLNHDGTLGVALGALEVSFFSTDLRLQGGASITPGGAGATLHPLHANSKSVLNPGGLYQPDTHLAFVGSGDRTIDIIDTFHFNLSGRIFIKDLPAGPLQAVLPFPEDNLGLTCGTTTVLDDVGATIGEAIEIYQGGDFNLPHPAIGGPTEDSCIVVKLVGITDRGGVVVIDVRKSDVLRFHPTRN